MSSASQPSPRLRVALGGGGAPSFSRMMPSPLASPAGPAFGGGDPAEGHVGPTAAAKAVAAKAAAASSGSSSKKDAPPAPRAAKDKLRRAREAFKLSASQFAALLTSPAHPVNQQLLVQWEMGLRRLPQPICAKVEQMHAQLLDEQKQEQEAAEAASQNVVLVNPEYPYQEPMIGPDYQIGVPRSASGSSKQRADECIWSPRLAAKEAASVDQYLAKVRALLKGCDALRQPGEGAHHTDVMQQEIALETLHELGYNQQEALHALELCVAWQRGDEKRVLALPRGAVVNSMLWLQRLTEAKRRRTWGAGEVEVMDWGLTTCARDLIQMGRHTLQEKNKTELIEMYYHAPRKTARTQPGWNTPAAQQETAEAAEPGTA